jgi:hypothetical protein
MNGSIQSAIDLLMADLEKSAVRVTRAREDLVTARDEHGRLERALKALGQVGDGSATRGPTKDMVRPIVQRLLADNPDLEPADLYDLVREKLAQSGVSANGLGLRMRELMAEEWAMSPLDVALTSNRR